jgi:hypothetical protein
MTTAILDTAQSLIASVDRDLAAIRARLAAIELELAEVEHLSAAKVDLLEEELEEIGRWQDRLRIETSRIKEKVSRTEGL